ncbi:hypothetical protein EDB92DRAFT_1936077 [Lactarius akahatsu]|uniref:Uncharacterized protein n=1 Tax=Lactarius akahatsu TaxID=416441 RepID=A0AAD4LGC8_9AGAM|nr:hypothetical protein EDB92DRAFT_1936077 [Lactarius akahatsu]
MTDPWPQWLVNSFSSANQPQLEFATDESAYYGPYTRLLYHLFGIEGPFEISPQYPSNSSRLNKHPVFFIQVKPLATLSLDSKRKRADDQMRDHFRDLRHSLVTPRLPGVSAFGTRMAFYEYVVANNRVTPGAIPPDPNILNDLAPIERWNCDLLEDEGINRIRQVVQDVKAMCQALGN